MAVKVFLTGITGYIGGTAFEYVYNAHKDYEYTVLVRDEARAQLVKAKYPSVKFVYGTLEDSEALEKAAAEADIVIHTADSSDHASGALAIAKGLKQGHTAEKPGYWLHLSGTGILTWYDLVNKRGGEGPLPEQKYYDIDGIERLQTLPDEAPHRDVDKIVQGAASDSVKILILCPPLIYGKGSGISNQQSVQLPNLIEITLKEGFAPIVGAGKTEWDNVHVDDLGDLYVKLVDATQDPSKNNNPEIFGPNGYFFAANGTHAFAKLAEQVAGEVKKQGYKADVPTKSVSLVELQGLKGYAPVSGSFGLNSKGVPQRAKKYLGWEPKAAAIEDTIAEAVHVKAKSLGL
ncbi:nadp-binding domain [Trichoderma arundinaceum]|uniref:Nadp-binding domain n=1 Tax=Trichoderma arundinaceum TaxID=490622 RepID=A0A395NZV4_TRIAR|nr:nadp-binding domain [Trichoderma arundinaceum]